MSFIRKSYIVGCKFIFHGLDKNYLVAAAAPVGGGGILAVLVPLVVELISCISKANALWCS